jgi:hypothetical protein
MSQETQIGNLSGGISDEDSKLVDSILNDLNSHSEGQPRQQQQPQHHQQQEGMGQMPRQELTPEQMRQIQMQRQMAMQQQQLMQQQEMAQRMAAQQMAAQQMTEKTMPDGVQEKKEMLQKNDSIIDQIKNESKSVILVIFLSIILNLEQVDGLFKTQPSIFTTESGTLNMQAIFVKALIIGAIFYGVKTYLL